MRLSEERRPGKAIFMHSTWKVTHGRYVPNVVVPGRRIRSETIQCGV